MTAAADRPHPRFAGDPAVREDWDRRYAGSGQLWSGRPNGALVAEVDELPPGRALDVGCGEGADAIWLAQQGWDVTALEVSGVALERAAVHAGAAGAAVRWVHAGLVEAALPPASFDLVSAMYPALLRTSDAAAERALLAAVAPGGVLLLVHHAGMETGARAARRVRPGRLRLAVDGRRAARRRLDGRGRRAAPPCGAAVRCRCAPHRRRGAAGPPAPVTPPDGQPADVSSAASSSSTAAPVCTARRCRCGTVSRQPVKPRCILPS